MDENSFSIKYFTSFLQEACGLSEEKDGSNKILTKVTNITIGHVLAAHSLGSFTDLDVLRWIHKGRKLTPIIEKQFEFYRKLAKYLISCVMPEDVCTWKNLLKDTKYIWPTEEKDGWACVFGEVPELCEKIDIEHVEEKKYSSDLGKLERFNASKDHQEHTEEISLEGDGQNKNLSLSPLEGSVMSESVEIENLEILQSEICTIEGKTRNEKHKSDNEVTSDFKHSEDMKLDENNDTSKVETSIIKDINKDVENYELHKSDSDDFDADFFANEFFDIDEEDQENNESVQEVDISKESEDTKIIEDNDLLSKEGEDVLSKEGEDELSKEGEDELSKEGEDVLSKEGEDVLSNDGEDVLSILGKDDVFNDELDFEEGSIHSDLENEEDKDPDTLQMHAEEMDPDILQIHAENEFNDLFDDNDVT
ncbi:unnamed protein product, partial [Meganyctiphanes norvegica]